jgi:RimJ/RimL family protein N-acetyltransferase
VAELVPAAGEVTTPGPCLTMDAGDHDHDAGSLRARFGIGVLSRDFTGRGLGSAATRLVLAYAFDQMRLHRVDLRVLAFNAAAIRCYERCGVVTEGA